MAENTQTPEDTPRPVDDVPIAEVADELTDVKSQDPPPAAKDVPPPSFGALALRATDSALHFLSHASNEMLGACFVGLSATTYMILGRFGLLVIGVAGGVVLHATWEGIRGDQRDDETKRIDQERKRETAVEIAKRLMEWRTARIPDETVSDTKVLASQTRDYSSFEPQTRAALNRFTDAVVRDYVRFWYSPTLPGENMFPRACQNTLTAFILSLSGHLQHKRPADALLDFVTNASSIIIVFLNELSAALHASPNSRPEDAIPAYLRLKPESSLSYMLNENSQSRKLGEAAEDILQAYLDPKSYNCEPVHVFLKEVLAQLILGYTIVSCSRPEWINEWIVYGLEESETTKEVMDIVDAGVERGSSKKLQKVVQSPERVDERHNITLAKRSDEQTSNKEHKRQSSRAEEAMDEAMKEARRLTQLMIEEDERRLAEEQERQSAAQSSEDVSDATTQGIATPSSSQSEQEQRSQSVSESVPSNTAFGVGNGTSSLDNKEQFTSFDQLINEEASPTSAHQSPVINTPQRVQQTLAPLTLHNANVSIFDDSVPGERSSIKAKPTTDYLLQIEPATSAYPGWMIARKYTDFEMLHEVLRRISVITGVPQFTTTHAELPKWKANTKANLRLELERYLIDAVRYQPLAESEGMKRFLDKDQALSKSPGSGKGFGWPTPDAFGKLGGDVMSVLTKAPKQVAGGGKAVFGGVAGGGKAVFGGVAGLVGGAGNQKRANASQMSLSQDDPTVTQSAEGVIGERVPRTSVHILREEVADSVRSVSTGRPSQDSVRSAIKSDTDAARTSTSAVSLEANSRPSVSSQPVGSTSRPSTETTASHKQRVTTKDQAAGDTPSTGEVPFENYKLPPRPDEIPDDFDSPISSRGKNYSQDVESNNDAGIHSIPDLPEMGAALPSRPAESDRTSQSRVKTKSPITESETTVAIELVFAVITELYTLSSVWNIRRTLLTAAKTFLLRPGNPQLTTIRQLLQTSLLENNLGDEGLAGHIDKLRANALPTAEELEGWKRDYPEKTAEEKEALRVKARHLLITKGMPQALTSVMGAAASGDALGKVFDCLQIPSVSRGLIFGLLLQALKIITH